MAEPLSNRLFIDTYLSLTQSQRQREGFGDVILPFEEHLLKEELSRLDREGAVLASERAFLAVQSGDGWHDGAFNENDRDVRFHDKRVGRIINALQSRVVGYPELSETRVTLGSQVELDNGGRVAVLNIVGFPGVHAEQKGVIAASIEAPIVSSVLGKTVGETALLRVVSPPRLITVIKINQESIRNKAAAYHEDTRKS